MLFELVGRTAAGARERPVVISGDDELSYGECFEQSRAVACGLHEHSIHRFGSHLGSTADAVVALTASSATGSEACVYPRDPGGGGPQSIALSLGHQIVVTDTAAALGGPTAVTLSELGGAPARRIDPPTAFPVLILTTGTTGQPKAARHDWERLLKAVRHHEQRSATRWLLAYNLNQFAGVQVLLHALASGGTLVDPESRRPEDVVAAIRTHRVTHASGTPTFWRLLTARLDRRAASKLKLEQITLGGEAVSEELIGRLRRLFPAANISHIYAGTEFGSAVSVRDGHSGLPISVLERADDSDVQFRIADGELQLRSRVGMLGYHGGTGGGSEWLETGDLVEIRDGRIHFVGRTSEMINVGGAKVHPLPVEELVCSIDGVQLAAVYGRPNAVTGQIVAIDVVPVPDADEGGLEQRIREVCGALPAAARPRRIRFVDDLEIRGNKVIRREARSVGGQRTS